MVTVRARWDHERAAMMTRYEQVCRAVALSEPEEEDEDNGCFFPNKLGFPRDKMLPRDCVLGLSRNIWKFRDSKSGSKC